MSAALKTYLEELLRDPWLRIARLPSEELADLPPPLRVDPQDRTPTLFTQEPTNGNR